MQLAKTASAMFRAHLIAISIFSCPEILRYGSDQAAVGTKPSQTENGKLDARTFYKSAAKF